MSGNFSITESFSDPSDAGFYEGAVETFSGAVLLESTSTATSSGTADAFGAVSMTASGSTLSVGFINRFASATLASSSSLTVIARSISGDLQITTPLDEFWFYRGHLTPHLDAEATSSMAVDPSVTTYGQATLSAEASTMFVGSSARFTNVMASGTATMTVAAEVLTEASISLSSAAVTVFDGYPGLLGDATLAGEATLTSTAMMVAFYQVPLAATSQLVVDGSAVKIAQAEMRSSGTMSVVGTATSFSYHWFAGESTLEAKPARIAMHGKSTLSVVAWPPTVHLGDDTAQVNEDEYVASQNDWQVQWSNRVRKSLANA